MIIEKLLQNALKSSLSSYSSVENINVKYVENYHFNAELKLNEINYVADVLSIDKIENFLDNEFWKHLSPGILLNMDVQILPFDIKLNLTNSNQS